MLSAKDLEAITQSDAMLDLLVIGAGPHALSLLARLVDDEPDLLTESQRTFTMSKARHAKPKEVVREHLKRRFDAVQKLIHAPCSALFREVRRELVEDIDGVVEVFLVD